LIIWCGRSVEALLNHEGYKPSIKTIQKVISVSKKNDNDTLSEHLDTKYSDLLDKHADIHALLKILKRRISSKNPVEDFNYKNELCSSVNAKIQTLSEHFVCDELKQLEGNAIATAFLNRQSNHEKNLTSLPQFINLMNQHEELIQPFSEAMRTGQDINIKLLIETYNDLGLDTTIQGLNIIKSDGVEVANQHIVLNEIEDKEGLEQLNHPEKPLDLEALHAELIEYNKQIRLTAIDDTDEKVHDYCDAMADAIDIGKHDFLTMRVLLKQLQTTYKAVDSDEMKVTKEKITDLESNAKSLIGIGFQRKANRVKDAIKLVSLKDRLHVFSDENNPACNNVRVALASHRKSFTNPLTAHNTVNEDNAANSFKDVKNAIATLRESEGKEEEHHHHEALM
jgi:hypothetical protein